jgi:hypothetical protein
MININFLQNFNMGNKKAAFNAYGESDEHIVKSAWKKFGWIFCIFVN